MVRILKYVKSSAGERSDPGSASCQTLMFFISLKGLENKRFCQSQIFYLVEKKGMFDFF
jgi:hypothetical protein